ncbi:MAG: hypothetical protein ACYC05_13045 [Sulfuricella sp.]|nr:hypothetical protein [Gammaproteobacteria bacterium]
MTINIPETPAEFDHTRILERPDGFYWQDKETEEVFGPFATLLEAVQDMEYNADSDYEPGESLEEAEAELGIADWNDPDTGLPAEETHHIEDH